MGSIQKIRRTGLGLWGLLLIALSAAPVSGVRAEWRIEFADYFLNAAKQAGYSHPKYYGSYCTKAECEQALRQGSAGGFNASGKEARCVGFDCSKGAGGPGLPLGMMGRAGSSEALARSMAAGLVGSMIQAALSPPQDDTALQEQQEALEKARKEAEEQAKKAERQAKLNQLNAKNAGQQKQDNDTLVSLLGAPAGKDSQTNDALAPIDWGTRKTDSEPPRTGAFSPPPTLWQRLLCASSFSKRALAAARKGDEGEARFLNEQAERAMSGGMLEIACSYDQAPDVPVPSGFVVDAPEDPYQGMITMVQQDIRELGTIDERLHKLGSRKKEAEGKKKQAEKQLADSRTPAPGQDGKTGKKPSDDLTLQAQKLLKESEEELAALGREEKTLLDRQQEIKGRLKEVQEGLRQASGTK
jgi:hypothetical protein